MMKLAAARVNCGLSQQEVANELGVTRTTVGNWEHGRTAMSLLGRKTLAKLYEMDMEDIEFPKVEKAE